MTTSEFLFRVWPYTAFGLFAAGVGVRALLVGGDAAGDRRAVGEALDDYLGGRLARAGLLALGAGHLAALFSPRLWIHLGGAPWHLFLLEGTGIALGLGALASWTRAVRRELRRPSDWVLTDLTEPFFLALVGVAVATGVGTALVHRWGSSWSAVTVSPWARSLFAGRSEVDLVGRLPLLVRLHLFASFSALAAFPLSRAGALPVLVARRLIAAAARPVRRAWAALEPAQRGRALAARLWPEPEIRWVGPAPARSPARTVPSATHPSVGAPAPERSRLASGSKT